MGSTVKSIVKKYDNDRTKLLEMLRDVQRENRYVSDEAITEIANLLDISRVEVEGPATFYHFYSKEGRGKITIYVNNSASAELCGYEDVARAFERELGIQMNSVTADGTFGLFTTSCIGMCDQEPAAIINDVMFTELNKDKVCTILNQLREGRSVQDVAKSFGLGDGNNASEIISSMVKNNIRVPGPVFFSDYTMGEGLKKALAVSSLDVIEEVKKSNLRGRGGAGFPTGMKWGFCRQNAGERYVFCNVDEGEPGTFKDRVLLTERAAQVFEGMAIGGYALEAKEGYMYLRAEYLYMKPHLEKVLEEMRKQNLLGKNILGKKNFNFDIFIKVGAGAYVCGEESALIESAEGKRGEPRNRPPFPVQAGYLGKPTSVNNPETYGCVTKIMKNGAHWFKGMGTEQSAGVKLLSISGDVAKPGIYEVPFGKTVKEVLEMAGAKLSDVQAVQVGGPSGNCVGESDFGRKICYNDLGTGGAFFVIGKNRDLLKTVHNFMDFFVEESCGFCVPCRAGNVLLKKTLEKILVGNGTESDLKNIEEWGPMIKTASRCGLGQTSPNPLLTTLKNFRPLYDKKVRKDVDFMSQFNLEFAVDESCKTVGRKPNLHEE